MIFIKLCLLLLLVYSGYGNFCNDEFCQEYLEKEGCVELPEECKIQNSTYNGVFLPSLGPCNCCEYCLANLNEGEECAIGNPSSPTPSTICGYGLSCKLTNENATCQQMDTPCINSQLEYDKKVQSGTVGHLEVRPHCDRNGLYQPYHCIPGEICYCVSEDGNRIFGEVEFTPTPYFILTCECSRNYNKAYDINDRNLVVAEYFRCQSNGDYDRIQCIENKCFCVDADNGHLTYPKLKPVNVTSISESSVPCFNNKTHLEAEYRKPCERNYLEILNKTKNYEQNNTELIGNILPNCQLDGNYGPVQETITTKYCSDSSGNLLEDFEVLKTDPTSVTMHCKCARVRDILKGAEKPECCKNGNYEKIQRRRGLCRCVDENGNQIEKEVKCEEMDKLSCFTSEC
ncbi:hypothetical protein FQA39_LY02715 [Lamprigera yunnana]|nr:hypothetical protein FQA39_LY02715 [Lamprigera yunnana]